MKKSILFISPDYHCTFFYRNELRKLGWKADIYVPSNYPELMLFDSPDYIFKSKIKSVRALKLYRFLWQIWFFLTTALRYRYHFYHCGIDQFSFGEKHLTFLGLKDSEFRVHLWITKLLNIKIIHMPSGVPDEEMPEIVEKYGNKEEGVETEDPVKMLRWFNMLRKYCDMNIGYGHIDSTQYKATHIKYKVLDMNLYNPDLIIPEHLKLRATNKLRILHSFMFGEDRVKIYKGNIKGSRYIKEALDRLISEGYEIEYLAFDRVPAKEYRFIQLQADIVVEELIRGAWGSTALECIALGKPVITYIRPEWEAHYYQCFPETEPHPFINANKYDIYDVLKMVIENEDFRLKRSRDSRKWAEMHLSPEVNVNFFADLIKKL